MKDETEKTIEEQVIPEDLINLSEKEGSSDEAESYEKLIIEAASKWMFTIDERENLMERLEERKASSDYEKLTREEMYYFMIRTHLEEVPNEAQSIIERQITCTVREEAGGSYEENLREFRKRANHYLESICILA